MLRGTLHLILDDLPSYPGEEMWFPWLDQNSWDVFDHWRFVWEPSCAISEPVLERNG